MRRLSPSHDTRLAVPPVPAVSAAGRTTERQSMSRPPARWRGARWLVSVAKVHSMTTWRPFRPPPPSCCRSTPLRRRAGARRQAPQPFPQGGRVPRPIPLLDSVQRDALIQGLQQLGRGAHPPSALFCKAADCKGQRVGLDHSRHRRGPVLFQGGQHLGFCPPEGRPHGGTQPGEVSHAGEAIDMQVGQTHYGGAQPSSRSARLPVSPRRALVGRPAASLSAIATRSSNGESKAR